MIQLASKLGRFFYGIGIVAVGFHQVIMRDFRPEILPPFPLWAHGSDLLAIIVGLALMGAGFIIAGSINTRSINAKKVSLGLAIGFLAIVVLCHLPYIFFIGTTSLSRLEAWFGITEELAFCGGALIMARSFSESSYTDDLQGKFEKLLMPVGTIFYSAIIILFGISHFVYTDYVSTMVPGWLGMRLFWTYFFGVALIAAGIALAFRIFLKMAAWLLALAIFLFFLLFHIPDAIANPTAGAGNEIVRAFVALLFTGIALVVAREGEK